MGQMYLYSLGYTLGRVPTIAVYICSTLIARIALHFHLTPEGHISSSLHD